MIYLRKASERGHVEHGWLDSWHSFSFASYYDVNFMGFSALRVINEDRIAPGRGFAPHSHQDMEILTYVLSGTIEHQDSLGHREHITAGEFQIMSAGTGVEHSEYNASATEPLHLYQIWIVPQHTGIAPRYHQQRFPEVAGRQWILSPDEREGSLKVWQDMTLSRWTLQSNESQQQSLQPARYYWLQVVKGVLTINQQTVAAGDAVALFEEQWLELQAVEPAEILLFDLPPVSS